jgi:hypothetical protein
MTRSMTLRSLALTSLAAAGALALGAAAWSEPPLVRLALWALACLASEVLWVRLPVGRATVSMASCTHFAALIILPRAEAMIAAAVASAIGEAAFQRKPPIRVAFNAAQTALAVGTASWAFHALAGDRVSLAAMLAELRFVPLIVAGVAYFAVNTGAVSLAIALAERTSPWRAWKANFGSGYELLSNGALFSLGALVAFHHEAHGWGATLLALLPLLVAYEGYRRYVRARDREDAAEDEPRRAA